MTSCSDVYVEIFFLDFFPYIFFFFPTLVRAADMG